MLCFRLSEVVDAIVHSDLQAVMALEDVQLSELRAKYGDSSDEASTPAAKTMSYPTQEHYNGSAEPGLPENVRESDELYWGDDRSSEDEGDLEDPADWVEDLRGNMSMCSDFLCLHCYVRCWHADGRHGC